MKPVAFPLLHFRCFPDRALLDTHEHLAEMNSAADQTGESLRILMVQDNLADAELTERELKRAGLRFESERVRDARRLPHCDMMHFDPDLIISDHTLPQFDGLSALELAREYWPDTPFRSTPARWVKPAQSMR